MMSLWSLVFLCFVAFSVSCGTSAVVKPESHVEHGHHVSILFDGEHHCSGSIIEERHILTSSRCIRMYGQHKTITIRVGSDSVKTGGVKYSIQHKINHDDPKADIALLRTDDEIEFNKDVKKIEFIDNEVFGIDYPLTILAWKHMPRTGVSDDDVYLDEYQQKVYDNTKCNDEYKWDSPTPMCTYDPTERGLCHTDAGGAIMANGFLIGIHSNSRDCMDRGDITVHTAVYPHESWINREMKKRNHNLAIPDVVPRTNQNYYHVYIRLDNNEHICSGAIINERHILTSKICVMGYKPEQLDVITGVTSLLQKGQSYSVQKMILYDNYDCDIAILRTNTDIAFNKNVGSIPITEKKGDLYYDEILTLTGYERSIVGRETIEYLQQISHRVIDVDTCAEAIPFVNDVFVCTTFDSNRKTACNMDDGSPIVAHGILVAMNPAGVFCSGRTYTILPLYNYRSWIEKTARLR